MNPTNSIFFLIIEARPTAGAASAQDLDGANVNVWVMEGNTLDAMTAACSHILEYAWVARRVRFIGEVTSDLMDAIDEVETHSYEEALRQGISATFYGWTTELRSPEFFEYRPLKPNPHARGKLAH